MLLMNKLLSPSAILKNRQILVVDNDRDSLDLYAVLLESYGVKVTTLGSVKEALDRLHDYIPTLLICEMNFLGESVYPLIQQIRYLALTSGRRIPILAISTCASADLTQVWKVKVDGYLIKPIDIDGLITQVWRLVCLSSSTYPMGISDWMIQQEISKALYCRSTASVI